MEVTAFGVIRKIDFASTLHIRKVVQLAAMWTSVSASLDWTETACSDHPFLTSQLISSCHLHLPLVWHNSAFVHVVFNSSHSRLHRDASCKTKPHFKKMSLPGGHGDVVLHPVSIRPSPSARTRHEYLANWPETTDEAFMHPRRPFTLHMGTRLTSGNLNSFGGGGALLCTQISRPSCRKSESRGATRDTGHSVQRSVNVSVFRTLLRPYHL